MLNMTPPGPTVSTMNRQNNQLLGNPPLGNTGIPSQYTSSYAYPSSMNSQPSYLPAGMPQPRPVGPTGGGQAGSNVGSMLRALQQN